MKENKFTKEGILQHLDEIESALKEVNIGLEASAYGNATQDEKKFDAGLKHIYKIVNKSNKRDKKS